MSKDCKYRIYEDDGKFYPQIHRWFGWCYLYEQTMFSEKKISTYSLKEARKAIEQDIADKEREDRYKNRNVIKKYHY